MSDTTANLSRRVLFRSAALAAGVLGSSALVAGCQPQTGAQAQPAPPPAPPGAVPVKQTKAQAAYQDQPNGEQRCGVCANFLPPNDCRVIQGPVMPNGWCRNFKAKA